MNIKINNEIAYIILLKSQIFHLHHNILSPDLRRRHQALKQCIGEHASRRC